MDQTWSVHPAAMAGVRCSHFFPCFCSTRRLRCGEQKLYTRPTRYIPFSNTSSSFTSLRPLLVNAARQARNVALSLSMYDVLICWPVLVFSNCPMTCSSLPHSTRRTTSDRRLPEEL